MTFPIRTDHLYDFHVLITNRLIKSLDLYNYCRKQVSSMWNSHRELQ
jgi:hypothetical protein